MSYIVQKSYRGAGESILAVDVCFSAGPGLTMMYLFNGKDPSSGDVTWSLVQYADNSCTKPLTKIAFSNPPNCAAGPQSYAVYYTS